MPTFENARYLFGRAEWQYWSQQPDEPDTVIGDSVRPIIDAGLADLVDSDHRLSSEVSLVPTPGHTPGHVSVRIESEGEIAFITGDMVHHPCQLIHPEWSPPIDTDGDHSHQTRVDFFTRCADRPVLVLGSHFAGGVGGHVVREGAAFRLVETPS